MSLNVTNMFAGCTSITEDVPAILFQNMPETAKADGLICVRMFDGCTEVTGIEAAMTEAIPNVEGTDMTEMFRNCTSITGTIPEMWRVLTKTVHTDCFKGCTNAANWADVPEDWGGVLKLKLMGAKGEEEKDLLWWEWDSAALPKGSSKLREVTIHCPSTVNEGVTKEGVYLGVWEVYDTDEITRKIGVSTNTQIVSANQDMIFRFPDNLTFTSGRSLRFLPLTNQGDSWPSEPSIVLGAKVETGVETAAEPGTQLFTDKKVKEATRVVGELGYNYVGEYVEPEPKVLILTVTMPEGRLELDLSSALWTGNVSSLASDTTSNVNLDWGDGTPGLENFDCSDKTQLVHTYTAIGTYKIKITGVLKWYVASASNKNPEETTKDLSAFLTAVDVPRECPIRQFCGNYSGVDHGFAFAHCTQLTHVGGDLSNGLVESATNKSSFGRMFWATKVADFPTLRVPATMTEVDLRGMLNYSPVKEIDIEFFNSLPATLTSLNCHDAFSGCSSLTSIPETLFDNLPSTLTTLNCGIMFQGTKLAALPAKFGAKIPNLATVDLSQMFKGVTALTSNLPEWWKTLGKTVHTGCFEGCTEVMNFVAVPSDWGGPTVFELVIDQSKSDPAQMVTYAGANKKATPMQMNFSTGAFSYGSWKDSWLLQRFKPCMLEMAGTVKYYLKTDDLTKKADGSDASADLTSTTHTMNAMVEVGQIWVKEVNEDGKFHIYLSSTKADGYDCWTHYNTKNKLLDKIYVPMYKGSKDSNGKMRSLSGQAPNVSEAGNLQRGYCQANGTGWDIGEWNFHRLMGYVVTLLGRSTNSQAVFGNGIEAGATNKPTAAVKTGGTEAKGWFYGVNNDYSAHVRVLGIEDLWGNVWELIGGVLTGNSGIYVKMTPGTADGTTGTEYGEDETGYTFIGNPEIINAESWPLDTEAMGELGMDGPSMQQGGGEIGADGVFRPVALTPANGNGQIASMQLIPGKGLFPASTETTMNTHYCDHAWWNLGIKCWARVGSAWFNAAGSAGVFALAVNAALGNSTADFGAAPAFKGE